MKVIPRAELVAPRLAEFATASGQVLARAHARTGDPIAIDAYIGKGRQFDQALGEFASSYARQTARDHQQLNDAVAKRSDRKHERLATDRRARLLDLGK